MLTLGNSTQTCQICKSRVVKTEATDNGIFTWGQSTFRKYPQASESRERTSVKKEFLLKSQNSKDFRGILWWTDKSSEMCQCTVAELRSQYNHFQTLSWTQFSFPRKKVWTFFSGVRLRLGRNCLWCWGFCSWSAFYFQWFDFNIIFSFWPQEVSSSRS